MSSVYYSFSLLSEVLICLSCTFFVNDTATTEIDTYGHTLSLHDALPISGDAGSIRSGPWAVDHPARRREATPVGYAQEAAAAEGHSALHRAAVDSGHGDRPAPAG